MATRGEQKLGRISIKMQIDHGFAFFCDEIMADKVKYKLKTRSDNISIKNMKILFHCFSVCHSKLFLLMFHAVVIIYLCCNSLQLCVMNALH